MTGFIFALIVMGGFGLITFGVVQFVTRPAMLFDKGPAHARTMGIVMCVVIAVVVLFVVNPDRITELKPRFWEAAGLAAFSAIFWLPWYLFAFTRRAKTVKENA